MSYAESGGAAAETAVGDKCAGLAQVHRLYVGGRVEHFLHSGTALWSLVGDYHHVAGLHLSAEYAFAGGFLGVEDLRRSGEFPYRLVHSGGLDHAAVNCNVALEHSESAVPGVGVGQVPDAATAAVCVKGLVVCTLTSHFRAEASARSAAVGLPGLRAHAGTLYAPGFYFFRQAHPVHPAK